MRVTGQPHRAPRRRFLWLAWLTLIAVEVLTQVALKFAGHATGVFDFSAVAFVRAISSQWLWIAVACYAAGFLTWMLILRDMHLSHAYPTSAIVFVAVMICSWAVLHESITPMQWLGAAIIVAGILQLGRAETTTAPSPTHPPE